MDSETYCEKIEIISNANEAGNLDLSDWEVTFMDNIYFKACPELSDGQKSQINRIYDRV